MEVQHKNSIVNKKDGDLQFENNVQRSRYTLGDTLPDIASLSIMAPITSSPKKVEGYKIEHVTKDDTERVMEHLRKFFFRDEPLNVYLDLLGKDKTERCQELEDYSLETLEEGHSLMAVSDSGEIIGVSLNNLIDKETSKKEDYSVDCSHPKFKKILRLLYIVDRDGDLFTKFPEVSRVMNIAILSVDGSWRGRGIAKALTDQSREVAIQNGAQMMRIDCTSLYSARAAARLGYECIFSLPYEEYEENGEQVFAPASPHTCVTMYVQKIVKPAL